jgi:hypothetical protein
MDAVGTRNKGEGEDTERRMVQLNSGAEEAVGGREAALVAVTAASCRPRSVTSLTEVYV